MKNLDSTDILGLTMAAGIWFAVAVGLNADHRQIVAAVVSTVLALVPQPS